jgi:hypothetical protein
MMRRGRKEADDEEVAVKAERSGAFQQNQLLLNEGNVYRQLENGPGIPRVYWFGMHHSGYNTLVMDLLGPSLQQVSCQCCSYTTVSIIYTVVTLWLM